MFTPEDLELLKEKGISEQQIKEQLHCFETGFPYLKLEAPAGWETESCRSTKRLLTTISMCGTSTWPPIL